jgi:hypothetical protein
MKIVLICLLFFSCIACDEPRRTPPADLEPLVLRSIPFSSYIRAFNRNYQRYRGESLNINAIEIEMVEDLPGTAVGMCYHKTKKMAIKRSYWKYADEQTRKTLIFHELGHCYLGRRHRSSTIAQIPISLMHPYLKSAKFYDRYENEYLEELFTRNTNQFSDGRFQVIDSNHSAEDELCFQENH